MIFVLLFGTGVSIFAYRTKLLAGFDKGLNESMHLYRPGNDELIADFDEMQETVNFNSIKANNKKLNILYFS